MPGFNMAAQTANGQPPPQEAVYTNGIHQTFTGRKCLICVFNYYLVFSESFDFLPTNMQWRSCIVIVKSYNGDILIQFPAVPVTAQGIPNGEAALQHAAYPGMQPFPGVGEWRLMCSYPLDVYYLLGHLQCV